MRHRVSCLLLSVKRIPLFLCKNHMYYCNCFTCFFLFNCLSFFTNLYTSPLVKHLLSGQNSQFTFLLLQQQCCLSLPDNRISKNSSSLPSKKVLCKTVVIVPFWGKFHTFWLYPVVRIWKKSRLDIFLYFDLNDFLPFQILFCALAAMAIYSDLLFTVSGDPIDVRASIYKNYCNKYFKNNSKRTFSCH